MQKKMISLLTAFLLTLVPYSSVNVYAESEGNTDNVFSLDYTYNGTSIVSVFSIEGDMISVGGFEAILQYDSNKYAVQSQEIANSNVLLNVIPDTGEIVVSMASASDNITESSELFILEFECSSAPVKDDFSFEITDVYRIADNYDTESVEYTFSENWTGFEESPDTTPATTASSETTTTTTTSAVTTTTSASISTETTSTELTTTTASEVETTATTTQTTMVSSDNNENNDFVISVRRNETENNVELSFAVKGNVAFWTAEGQIDVNSTGLGTPELLSAIPDALTSYNVEENSLYFTIVSSSGGNITEEQIIFTYVFPIEGDEYSISCTGKIADICDQSYNTVSYSLTEENEITPSQTTTTTTTTTSTTTLSTETTETTSSNDYTSTETSCTETTTTTETQIAVSPYELSNWAENDYYQKTGVEPYRSDYVENSNGTLTITLYDKQGQVLDTYTVHSKTGIGFNSDGDEIDLPQTGNNSLTPILVVLASLLFIILGAYAIKASGIVDDKHRHEKV